MAAARSIESSHLACVSEATHGEGLAWCWVDSRDSWGWLMDASGNIPELSISLPTALPHLPEGDLATGKKLRVLAGQRDVRSPAGPCTGRRSCEGRPETSGGHSVGYQGLLWTVFQLSARLSYQPASLYTHVRKKSVVESFQ